MPAFQPGALSAGGSACARGEVENRIKELHHGLQIDRTSCKRFRAHQLRILRTAAAYVLMQELRLRASGTACALPVSTLRKALLKLGLDRNLRAACRAAPPMGAPFADEWCRIARSVGAVPRVAQFPLPSCGQARRIQLGHSTIRASSRLHLVTI